MKGENELDPFWITKDGRTIYRGIPIALTGKEVGLKTRLKLLEGVKFGDVILSIGCGLGTDLNSLRKDDRITLGIDPERKFLDEGQKRSNAGNLVQAIGEHLPIASNCADLVLLFEVLEHVMSPEETIHEIRRILKPSGYLLLTVPNRFYLLETHGARICSTTIFLGGIGIPFFSMFPNFIRRGFEKARIYDQAEILQSLRNNGFDPLILEYLMPPLDIVRQTSIAISIRKCLSKFARVPVLRLLGANIIVLSRKYL